MQVVGMIVSMCRRVPLTVSGVTHLKSPTKKETTSISYHPSRKHHDGAQDPKGNRKSLKPQNPEATILFPLEKRPSHRTSVLLKDWPMNIGPIFCTESGPGIKKSLHTQIISDLRPPKNFTNVFPYKKGSVFKKERIVLPTTEELPEN